MRAEAAAVELLGRGAGTAGKDCMEPGGAGIALPCQASRRGSLGSNSNSDNGMTGFRQATARENGRHRVSRQLTSELIATVVVAEGAKSSLLVGCIGHSYDSIES